MRIQTYTCIHTHTSNVMRCRGLMGEWILLWRAGSAVSAWLPGLIGNSQSEWWRQAWLHACSSTGFLAAPWTLLQLHLQLHGLTYSSMGSLAAPWAHLQLNGLTCSSMGSPAAQWAHLQLHGLPPAAPWALMLSPVS